MDSRGMEKMAEKKAGVDSRQKGLLRLITMEQGKLLSSGMLAIIGHGCGILPYYFLYRVIMEVSTRQSHEIGDDVYLLIACGGLAIVVKHVFLGLSTALSHLAAYDILYALRSKLVEKLRRLPLGYFDRKNTGQLKKVMSEDVEQLEIFLAHNVPDFVGAFVYMLLATVLLFIVDWRMGLANIIVIPVGVGVQMLTMGRGREFITRWFAATEKMNSAIIEYIQGMPIIKAFNHTVESFSKYSESIDDCLRLENRASAEWYLPMSVFSVSITANMLFLLPTGALLYLSESISLGKFVFFLLMGIGLGTPMWTMVQFGRIMQRNLESLARIDGILDAAPLTQRALCKNPGKGIYGSGVVFGYEPELRVIDNIYFSIAERKIVALVGPSGAGKTTLARLIPRFWDLDAGEIDLGATDIRDIGTDDLMAQFGLIFQNVHLFNDTVLANLQIGRAGASRLEVIEAARAAQCHDFIMALPEGYNTIIGERGARISGGERQRLSIARAFLKDAPILILDEATAFIDPENETLLQEAINRLVANKTLVVIAHRLSTIIAADEIMVLDKGRISARGTHNELLVGSVLYKNMWDAHMAARNWDFKEQYA